MYDVLRVRLQQGEIQTLQHGAAERVLFMQENLYNTGQRGFYRGAGQFGVALGGVRESPALKRPPCTATG